MKHAARNIRRVAEAQLPRSWSMTVEPGVRVGQRVTPLDTIGCYVPGGRFSLVSTLLMTAVPARVAGVRRIVVACPKPNAALLAVAELAGVTEILRIGGAQAIAALAYGTRSVPRVDKIFGPGNRYVTAAKNLVSADCAIDMLAGPTEVLVVATRGQARYIAADLMAQAEHDPDAMAILVTTSRALANAVQESLAEQLSALPPQNPARRALSDNGVILLAKECGGGGALCQSLCSGASEPSWSRTSLGAPTQRRRAACSSAHGVRNPSATTPAAQTTCCPPGAARARAAGFPPGILFVAQACSSLAALACGAWRRWFPRWPMPRDWWPTGAMLRFENEGS